MQREAHTEREWGRWPGRRTAAQGGRDRLKALFTPSGGTEDPPPSNGDDVAYAALSRAYVELDDRERRVSALQDELHALLRASRCIPIPPVVIAPAALLSRRNSGWPPAR